MTAKVVYLSKNGCRSLLNAHCHWRISAISNFRHSSRLLLEDSIQKPVYGFWIESPLNKIIALWHCKMLWVPLWKRYFTPVPTLWLWFFICWVRASGPFFFVMKNMMIHLKNLYGISHPFWIRMAFSQFREQYRANSKCKALWGKLR